jgi:hypothetical protein
LQEKACAICGKTFGTFLLASKIIEIQRRGIDLPYGVDETQWICYEDFIKIIKTSPKSNNSIPNEPKFTNVSNYDILGISNNANESEIKEAFRTLSLKYHSDRGGEDKNFIKIKQAYEDLKIGKKVPENTIIPNTNVYDDSAGIRGKITSWIITIGIFVVIGVIMGFFFGLK